MENHPLYPTAEQSAEQAAYLDALDPEARAAYSRSYSSGLISGLIEGTAAQAEIIENSDARIAELNYEATHNPVSNLPNQRALERRYAEIREQYPDAPLAMIAIDIGSFKAVNDRLGHARGDELLRMIGRGLHRRTDAEGIVINPHGDEYILCSPLISREDKSTDYTPEERLEAILGRIRNLAEYLNETFPELRELGFDITAGGIIAGPDTTLQESLKQADAVMYEVKRAAQEATYKALPLRQRIAYKVGTTLLKYSKAPGRR